MCTYVQKIIIFIKNGKGIAGGEDCANHIKNVFIQKAGFSSILWMMAKARNGQYKKK